MNISHDSLEPFTGSGVFYSLGNTYVGIFWRINQKSRRDRNTGRSTRALGVDRLFSHLHQNFLPISNHLLDRRILNFFVSRSFNELELRIHKVSNMHKRGPRLPYVNEGTL